jgi:hypothetical protein
MAIGEEAVVTNAMKAVRQGVEQEAADELVGAQAMTFDLPWWRWSFQRNATSSSVTVTRRELAMATRWV